MRSFSEFFWVKMALSALIGCMIGLFPLFLDAIISIFRKKKNDFAHGADGPFKEYPPFLTQYENHILSREQKKMSDFIQHGIDGYHAVQTELLRLSAENQALNQAVQEKGQRIACIQADLEQAHKRCEELERQNNMLLRQQRQAKQGHKYDSIEP